MQHSYCTDIPWGEAQPDDLVFYPDDSHVGIAGGTDADGNLLIVHCSGGANGVVITGSAGLHKAMYPTGRTMLPVLTGRTFFCNNARLSHS